MVYAMWDYQQDNLGPEDLRDLERETVCQASQATIHKDGTCETSARTQKAGEDRQPTRQEEWRRLERAFSAAYDFIRKQSSVDYDGDFPQPNAAFDLCAILNEAMPLLYALKPKCSDCAARYANTGGCRDCEGP